MRWMARDGESAEQSVQESVPPERRQTPFWQRALPVVFGFPLVATRLGWQTAAVILGMALPMGLFLKYAPIPAWKPKVGEVFPVRETPISAVLFIVAWVSATLALALFLKSRFDW